MAEAFSHLRGGRENWTVVQDCAPLHIGLHG
jgi:hypothetical protein